MSGSIISYFCCLLDVTPMLVCLLNLVNLSTLLIEKKDMKSYLRSFEIKKETS